MKKLLVFCLLFVGVLTAQTSQTGDLTAYVDSYISGLPGIGTNAYQTPSTAALGTWGRVITDMLNASYSSAQTRADSIGYRLIIYTDNGTAPNRTYYMLTRKTTSTNYWGMFILNPSATRAKLFIQSPHPKYDSNTGTQGFYIFKNVNARAFIISGTHRCNNNDSTLCDGTTTACDGGSKYKISDQAHNVTSTFQRATEILLNLIPNLIIIQPHGFGQDAGDPDAIMSNGTRVTPAIDFLVKLKSNLYTIDTSLSFKIAHVDLTWTKLVATQNTQGRYLNGSNDPCYSNPATANGRFLHIEQALTGLRDNATNRKKLSDAIALTFPENANVVSGNWNSADTWMKGSVPKSTDDVYIISGSTVTVTTSTDSCNSIAFESTSAKLSLSASAVLNVTGDFSLASTSHAAFSSWGSNAKIEFTGSAATQTISGFSTSSFSTSFVNLVVDKSSGTVTTDGTGMRLSIGTSLLINSGTFVLAANDDIETRDFSGTASAATITVQAAGILQVAGSDSYIRSGGNTDTITSRTGKLTIYGTVYLATISSNRLNFGGIDVENGGELQFTTGWTGATAYFNSSTVNVKSGGLVTVGTTTALWHASGWLNLQSGAMLDITSSSAGLPTLITANGTVQYSRASAQTISNKITTYNVLVLTGSGIKTLGVNSVINGTLRLSGKASVSLGVYTLTYGSAGELEYASSDTAQTTTSSEFPSSGGPRYLHINNSLGVTLHAARTISLGLILQSGQLNNSSYALTLSAGAQIQRYSGSSLTAAPVFGSTVNVEYLNTSSLTSSYEIPVSTTVLQNLLLSGSQGITLGGNTTINSALTLNSNILLTGSYTLTFGTSAANPTETATGYISGTAVMNSRSVGTGTLTFLMTAISGSGDAGSVSITRVTGTAITGSSNQSISANWTLSSSKGSITNKTAALQWYPVFDNSKTFSSTNKAACWISTNGGSVWQTEYNLTNVAALSPRVLSVPFTAGAKYTVSDSLHPLIPSFYSEVIPEALWSGSKCSADTFTAEIRGGSSPHTLIASSSAVSDTTGKILFTFSGVQNATSYYLVISHKNSIAVWSAATQQFLSGVKGYIFTDAASKAYGSNMKLVSGKYCLYSGDVNQDGFINDTDVNLISADADNFATGYSLRDLNADGIVDLSDLIYADNNRFNNVARIIPAK